MEHSRSLPGDVTVLLRKARQGDGAALNQALPLVYEELRHLARKQIRAEAQGHTLDPTELVHEAYIKLLGGAVPDAENRSHLLAMAARAMRQLLVDHARSRKALKRGGEWKRTTLHDGPAVKEVSREELLALDEAMEELDPRQRQVVECRFFAGLEESEIAGVMGVSERTVRRDWVKARAWLYARLYPDGDGGGTRGP